MPPSWNEIRDRAVHFSREWSQEAAERAGAQTFWNEFFEVLGISRRRDGGKTANSVIDQQPEAFPSRNCLVVPACPYRTSVCSSRRCIWCGCVTHAAG